MHQCQITKNYICHLQKFSYKVLNKEKDNFQKKTSKRETKTDITNIIEQHQIQRQSCILQAIMFGHKVVYFPVPFWVVLVEDEPKHFFDAHCRILFMHSIQFVDYEHLLGFVVQTILMNIAESCRNKFTLSFANL